MGINYAILSSFVYIWNIIQQKFKQLTIKQYAGHLKTIERILEGDSSGLGWENLSIKKINNWDTLKHIIFFNS